MKELLNIALVAHDSRKSELNLNQALNISNEDLIEKEEAQTEMTA